MVSEQVDSPTFRSNVRRTGATATSVLPKLSRLRWRFATNHNIFSTPAVAAGLVCFGGRDRVVHALDQSTGAERWQFLTGKGISSSPTILADAVYIGSEDGNLYRLDAASGKPHWHFAAGQPIASSPAVVDGVVCVGSGGTRGGSVGAPSMLST